MKEVNFEETEWVFTFGWGQKNAGKCVRIKGTFYEARKKMFAKFGNRWAFQYSAKKWDEWKKDPEQNWCMEQEIDFEEAEA